MLVGDDPCSNLLCEYFCSSITVSADMVCQIYITLLGGKYV